MIGAGGMACCSLDDVACVMLEPTCSVILRDADTPLSGWAVRMGRGCINALPR